MNTDAKEEYELTSNPVDGTFGFICRTHGIHRAGLTQRHATNVEAKHIREQHSEDHALTLDLDLAGLARNVLAVRRLARGRSEESSYGQRWDLAMTLWEGLIGMEGPAAITLAEKMAEVIPPPRAHVPPF